MAEGVWVLVADCSRARIFRDDREGLVEIMDFAAPAARQHTRDLVSDRSGRRASGSQAAGSSPGADPKDTAALRFAAELALVLARAQAERVYERLLIAAPPHFLGLLRKQLEPRVSRLIAAEIPHDFTLLRADEISDRIHAQRSR